MFCATEWKLNKCVEISRSRLLAVRLPVTTDSTDRCDVCDTSRDSSLIVLPVSSGGGIIKDPPLSGRDSDFRLYTKWCVHCVIT